ncbi:hypothetical protein BSP239C_03194 [Brevibacterium sp. 239c]|uniref:hypothetical protein n=1 Tax=Brevibacterium sp. 239c TaxID=1965356 RepID=UPI000C5B8585|nr:hypothetical protein [Brevibacterium sp. 239c]SMY01206.1 hypothetical protein BSP239C_03194 [Brevibacterium sp. 239c]
MNRYIIDGLIADLHNGKRIVIVAPTVRQSSFAFRTIADAMSNDEAVSKIRRANGQESITTHTGGYLTFIAVSMYGGRGFYADTVVALSPGQMTDKQVLALLSYTRVTQAELIQA